MWLIEEGQMDSKEGVTALSDKENFIHSDSGAHCLTAHFPHQFILSISTNLTAAKQIAGAPGEK